MSTFGVRVWCAPVAPFFVCFLFPLQGWPRFSCVRWAWGTRGTGRGYVGKDDIPRVLRVFFCFR